MGAVGMFLMIPMASVLYAMLREWTQNRLKDRQIAEEKLQAQPPELRSHFRQNREKRKKKAKKTKEEANSETE